MSVARGPWRLGRDGGSIHLNWGGEGEAAAQPEPGNIRRSIESTNRSGAMAAAAAEQEKEKELLSSVVDDIRSYSGSDPLRPWLRYGAAARRSLPPSLSSP